MTELTLTRVVLYKTGVGFFEKRGKIDLSKEKSIELSFKTLNMDDLLKTFAIMKTKGTLTVVGVSYTGQDTNQAKMLQDSLIRLPEENTFLTFLSQLRGVDISITVGQEKLTGAIIGIQNRLEPVGDKSLGVIDEPYLIFKLPIGIVKNIRVKDVEGLIINDLTVKNDLKFFMDIIKSGKSDKTRSVVVYFDGKDQAEFVLSFLQEIPAWKCSYRLFMGDEEEKSKSETIEPDLKRSILLQGWAIIDNVLNEDFEKVRLSLVSGLPISFKYDLYTNLWINRPYVERAQKIEVSHDVNINTRGIIMSGDTEVSSGKPDNTVTSPSQVVGAIINNTAAMGSGFEYKIPMLVNVKRNQSSLIPLLQSEGKATLVSVYNQNVDPVRPMCTLEFKNETGMILESGPISVFNNYIFEGEAVLPYMEKEEQQRIPYSVDQGIEVNRKVESESHKFHYLSLSSSIYQKYYIDKHTIYKIKNITGNPKTLIIEHARENNYKIYEPEKADEETRNFYRFRIPLAPNETKEITVNERREMSSYTYFDNLNRSIISEWLMEKLLKQKEYDFLLKFIELAEQRYLKQREMDNMAMKKQEITEEQARIRRNMDILGQSESEKKLNNRYLAKFERREAEIEAIDKKVLQLSKENAQIDQELAKMRNIGFEK